MLTEILTIGFALIVAWAIISPLLRKEVGAMAAPSPYLTLKDQSERCAQVLRDLELDYSTHKISADDYQKTKASLEVELAAILEQSDDAEKRS